MFFFIELDAMQVKKLACKVDHESFLFQIARVEILGSSMPWITSQIFVILLMKKMFSRVKCPDHMEWKFKMFNKLNLLRDLNKARESFVTCSSPKYFIGKLI